MTKKILCLFAIMLLVAAKVGAQDNYADQVKKYIDKFAPLAIEEQKKAGIPASITLAQGIHETDGGSSELMVKANNHFGIKCKPDWKGETILHSDNTPNECFKKYKSAEESYNDHTEHLKKNPRYNSLFSLSITDYAAWAIGLKTCGYATSPQYSVSLIKIIEDYHLQEYTYKAMDATNAKFYPLASGNKKASRTSNDADKSETEKTDSLRRVVDSMRLEMTSRHGNTSDQNPLKHMADSANKIVSPKNRQKPQTKAATEFASANEANADNTKATDKVFDSGKIIVINGLRAFYAYKDEMLLKYAVKYKIRYARLLELNDLPDAPLQDNMPIYIEKKLVSGTHSRHTVKKNETMQLIAQEEAIQLKRLQTLNKIAPNEEPVSGAILELQTQATAKPPVVTAAQKKRTIQKTEDLGAKKKQDNDYIAISHPKPQEVDTAEEETEEETKEVVVAEPVVKKKAPVLKEDTSAEDLAGLKADLDKNVYADNNKLKAAKPKPFTLQEDEKPVRTKKEIENPGPKGNKKEAKKKPKRIQ